MAARRKVGAAGDPRLERVGRALDLLQEKWTLNVVHALLEGPLGFNDLHRRVGGVAATTLSQRLETLETAGLLARDVLSVSPPRTRYRLTPPGEALRAVLEVMRDCEVDAGTPGPAWHPEAEVQPPEIVWLLQEKWALHVILILSGGPRGFNELSRALGVNVTTLGQRLERLETLGLVRKTVLSHFPPRNTYELTGAAVPFRALLQAVEDWAETHLFRTP